MRVRGYAIAVAAVLVGGLAPVPSAGAATAPVVARVQAESMTRPAGASIVADARASNGRAVRMTRRNTSLTKTIVLRRAVRSVTVRARGTSYLAGWPRMSLKIDGRAVMPLTRVARRSWQTYSARVSLRPGTHRLSLTYSNTRTRGRHLYVDAAYLYGAPVLSLPGQTTTIAQVPKRTVSATYFGGHILGPLETNIGGTGVATAWPSWRPTTVRLWNTYGYNTSTGAYEGLSWSNLNTANGVYNWTLFDAVLAKLKAQGATDLLYTFGYTPTWAGGGANRDQAPSSNTYLSRFATAIAQRAIANGLPIRSWEVWNEPNNGTGTWIGTNAQMVAMAQSIHGAVKAVDPSYKVATPSPQGNATNWMNAYLAAGGGAYADIMAFHGYTSSAPETISTLIDSYKTVFATHGQSGKPVWDTEAMDLTTSDPALQARFLAIYYLLHQAKGLERLYWYAYDGDQGQEWFHTSGSSAAATADAQVHAWMLGTTPGTLAKSGTTYALPLNKGTQQTLAVWSSAGPAAYPAGGFASYTDLQGVVHPVSGATVTIGKDPILLR